MKNYTPNLSKRIYDFLVNPLSERWLGGLYVGTVIKGLYLQRALNKYLTKKIKRVLDAGCGPGAQYAVLFARRYPDVNFIGLDFNIDEGTLKPYIKKLSNLSCVKADLLNIKWRNHFDIVYTIDVLEHIVEYRACLQNMIEALRKGGIIIAHVPNVEQKRYFFKSARYVSSLYALPKKGDAHVREGFKKDDLETDLRQAGLKVLTSKYTFDRSLSIIKELFNWCEKHHLLGVGIVLLPITIILWGLEVIFGCKRGNGIMIIASKN